MYFGRGYTPLTPLPPSAPPINDTYTVNLLVNTGDRVRCNKSYIYYVTDIFTKISACVCIHFRQSEMSKITYWRFAVVKNCLKKFE